MDETTQRRRENAQLAKVGKKRCSLCHQVMDANSEVFAISGGRLSSECRVCQSKRTTQSRHVKVSSSFEGFIRAMLPMWKQTDKKHGGKFNLDAGYLLRVLAFQEYKCAYTGRNLSFVRGDIDRLSLDRLDSQKGYVKGNIVFCSWIINIMKQHFTVAEFVKFGRNIGKSIHEPTVMK